MSTNEQQLVLDQQYASNGWQNIGIYYCFVSEQNLSVTEKLVLMDICRHSFGYMMSETKRMTQAEWSKICKISRQTFSTTIKSLMSKGFLNAVHGKEFVPDGGSVAYAYRAKFPTNGMLKIGAIKKNISKEEENERNKFLESTKDW